MLVSLVRGDQAFGMLEPVHHWTWQAKGGMPVLQPWKEVEFTRVDGALDEFIAVDCLTMNTGADGFLVSEYARAVLGPLLTEVGNFWPVRVFGQSYWWLNCMASIEALDRRNTDADWSVVSGDWGSFTWISTTRRLSFNPGRLRRAPVMFRIPEFPQGVLFAQEELRLAVERHKLIGFKFDPVWSAREGGVLYPPGFSFGGMVDALSDDDARRQRQTARETLASRV